MSDQVNNDRRRFLRNSAITIAAAEFAMMSSAYALPGAQSTKKDSAAGAPPIKPSTNASFGPLKHVNAGVLSIAYAEAGPANGPPVLLFHGWPYDIHSFVDVAPILAADGYRVLVPYLRGYGETRFLSAATPRNAQPAAVAADAISFMDALKIDKAVMGGFDWVAETRTFWLFSGPSASRPWSR
jgi:alpha/beta hydrolase family protein